MSASQLGFVTSKKLIVMRNMYAGFKKLRFMDVKIGRATAVANWCGKSEFRAWRNHTVD